MQDAKKQKVHTPEMLHSRLARPEAEAYKPQPTSVPGGKKEPPRRFHVGGSKTRAPRGRRPVGCLASTSSQVKQNHSEGSDCATFSFCIN